MSRGFKIGVLAAAVMAVAPAAQAFEAGDFVVRGGAVHVAPDDSSDSVTLGGAPLLGAGTDTKVSVDSNTQLGLRASYMFTNHLGLGILAATPFKHNITADTTVGAADGAKLAETKHLPPTITLQYFPMASSSAVQPYAGIGVNYTTFFDTQTTATLDGATKSAVAATESTELDLDDSIGVAVEVGVDYMLSDNFGLNAAMWWADINTDATVSAYDANGDYLGKTETFDVEIDPMIYMIGMTYKF